MQQQKTLLLWDRMGDYHRARWKALSAIIGKENCYGADLGRGDGLYHWTNTEATDNYICLSDNPVNKSGIINPFKRFKHYIKSHQITHVCIPGYGRPIYLLLLIWCRLNGIKVLMFAESWYRGHPLLDKLKGWFISSVVDMNFVSGKHAAAHFKNRLGICETKIVEGYSVVDNNHFASSQTKKQQTPTLLCVARFAEEKNLDLLINAFQASILSKKWHLKVVGGGPLKEVLQKSITTPNIELTNWLSYDQLPDLYASSTLFILPSKFEPWGLVVNEAMAAGLPIILSDAIGALPDLLMEGENGWNFKYDNSNELTNLFNHISKIDNTILVDMGKRSKEIIENYSCQTWANKIADWTAIS